MRRQSANAVRFFAGSYGLAESYTLPRQPSLWIWSTNVDSYCVVRGCLIESVISFKMSSRPDEILGGDPELAKQQLQEAGLNYFLFMKDCRMIDLLSLSKLFAPETIGRYLGVKWSGGSTYLLTRIGPDARPIGPDFLELYTRRRAEPDVLRCYSMSLPR